MLFRSMLTAAVLCGLAACTIAPEPKPGDLAYAPVASPALLAQEPNQGGIYRPGLSRPGNSLSLFQDARASRIGDVITVVLTESTTSSKKADTAISKSDKINIDAGVVLGATPRSGSVNMATSINPTRDFNGGASSDQSNRLQGNITVMVSDVLPNGLLEVRGEKWLTLNRGEELIRLRGYVRPEDVLPDNSISSTRVADVRITYSGSGELAQANRQGWLSRFFSSEFWPF